MGFRGHDRGLTLFFCGLLVLAPPAGRSSSSRGLLYGAAAKPARFTWHTAYADGLAAARERQKPLLVYFPPVRPSEEPAALRGAAAILGASPPLECLRVSADEVVDLKERLLLKRDPPAAILLDRRENEVDRWEGNDLSSPDFWQRVRGRLLEMEHRVEEEDKLVEEARHLADSGDLDGAYRKIAGLLASKRTAPEALSAARALDGRARDAARKKMLEILAGEGLSNDGELRKELEKLLSSTAHTDARDEILMEIARLERGTIGGR